MADHIHVHVLTPLISMNFRNASALHSVLGDICRLSSSCLDKGPASVESAVDEVLAAPGVVDAAIRAERDGADAIVIDCMLDPGIDAAREVVSIPVIGAGEAGLAAAARMGRFSVVTVLDRQAPMFHALARRHGLAHQLVSVRGIGVPVLALEQDRAGSIAKTMPECAAAMTQDGAQAVVFGCTGMLGFAEPVALALELPHDTIIDPLPHAVRIAIETVKTGTPPMPAPARKQTAGFDAWVDLAAIMRPEERA